MIDFKEVQIEDKGGRIRSSERRIYEAAITISVPFLLGQKSTITE